MKTLLSLTLGALAALTFLPLGAVRAAQEDEHEHTELAGHMEALEDTVKVLRKALREPVARADALAAIAEIQRLSLLAKGLVPEIAAKLPETERAALTDAYRRTMVDFLQRQLELEAALLDGDAAKLQAAFDAFREMEDSAHERFAPEDG
jgi:hypothetical protein